MEAGKFPIGIIGGTGGMGKWFASFFQRQGYPVQISGRHTGPDFQSMAKDCPVVAVSVPIEATEEVIRKIGPCMPRESLLMDFTSLKEAPVRTMLAVSISEVIGLHPLFGPRAISLDGQNIAVCPARGERWLSWLKDVLARNGALLTETTPVRHDQVMAVVQALNHFNTVLLGLAMAESGLSWEELQNFSTPTFRDRLDHLHRILAQPRLYAHLITGNVHAHKLFDLYDNKFDELKRLLRADDIDSVAERIGRLTLL